MYANIAQGRILDVSVDTDPMPELCCSILFQINIIFSNICKNFILIRKIPPD